MDAFKVRPLLIRILLKVHERKTQRSLTNNLISIKSIYDLSHDCLKCDNHEDRNKANVRSSFQSLRFMTIMICLSLKGTMKDREMKI